MRIKIITLHFSAALEDFGNGWFTKFINDKAMIELWEQGFIGR